MPDKIEEDQIPKYGASWAITYSSFDDGSVCLGVRSCGQLFYVEVATERLEGWLEKENFLQLLEAALDDDDDAEDSLYSLIWQGFLPSVRLPKLETVQEAMSLSLQDFYNTDVAAFEFDGGIEGSQFVRMPKSLVPHGVLPPQMKLKDIVGADKILHIDASRAQIKPRHPNGLHINSDAPTLVSLDDSPTLYHFKALQDPSSFHRELEILQTLAGQRLNKKYRLPTLHSLVVYSGSPDTAMGFLLQHIDHADNMSGWIHRHKASLQLRKKWYGQIKDMVRALHRCGVIWGDVKPENVLIDHARNAWVIDFGGGFSSGYVDQDVMETIEGDEQGVLRIGEMLLNDRHC